MTQVYLKNVSTLSIDDIKCTGCGLCTTVCPHQILSVEKGTCQASDKDLCMECGACVMNCPFNAITVEKGVGCFSAIIKGLLTGTEPSCDCSSSSDDCC